MNEQNTSDQTIAITDLSLKFSNSNRYVIDKLSVDIKTPGWTCLLGASGSGKTTLIKYLAGLLDTKMDITGNVSHPYPTELSQNIAYMAQHDTLFPWLTVIDNVLLPLRFSHRHQLPENRNKALSLLKMVGLQDYCQAQPEQLSGGMRQRVALARTLIQDKPFIILDEPFSALDAITRSRLQDLACHLLNNKTVLLITHDPLEAIKLACRLYVLHGTPSQANELILPATKIPRAMSASTGQLYNQVIHILEAGL